MNSVLRLISANLLPALAVACIAGIGVSAFWEPPTTLLATAVAGAASGLLLCCLRAWNSAAITAALSLFFFTGCIMGTVSSREPAAPDHIYNLLDSQQEIVAVGRLLAMPQFDGTTSQARIGLLSVRMAQNKQHVTAYGTLLLRLAAPWPSEYQAGTLLAIRAMVQRPATYGVPGAFDYPAELARQGIWVTGLVRTPAQLHKVVEQPGYLQEIRYFPERLRTAVGTFIDTHTEAAAAGLFRAILLGDRSRVDEATIERFTASGTMHILAISGIHMTIIGALFFGAVYWLLRRSEWLILHCNLKKIAGLLCLPLLAGYTLLAGSNTPAIRACIMSVMLILAFCSNRPKTIAPLIAFGALLILASSPQALFTASFQLSFTAFLSIALIRPVLQQLLTTDDQSLERRPPMRKRLRNWILSALLVACTATAGTAPIVIHHFHRFPLAGPLANLIMEPLICLWALPCGFLALPFMVIAPDIAALLLSVGGFGLDLATETAGLFQLLPWTSLWLPRPEGALIAGYYGALIWMIRSWPKEYSSMKVLQAALPFTLCFVLLTLPPQNLLEKSGEGVVVYFLDVGQGSATLIRFEDGTTMLIDGGGSAYGRGTVGERIIAPFLWANGVDRLDTIVMTHPDADHTNGIPFLLRHFTPQRLFASTLTGGNDQYQALLALAEERGVAVSLGKASDQFHQGQAIVTCLANTSYDQPDADNNNEGLVVALELDSARILFPGDIDVTTEKALIAQGVQLDSDILLAAHHGSASSNSTDFLHAVDPKLVIVSAGRSRNALFPSPSLRQNCDKRQLPLLVTAANGSIRVITEGNATDIQLLKDMHTNPLRRRHQLWLTTERIERSE